MITTEAINVLDLVPGDVIVWNLALFIVIAIREEEREDAPRLRLITIIDPETSAISSFDTFVFCGNLVEILRDDQGRACKQFTQT